MLHRQSGLRVRVQVLIELDRRDGLPPRFVVLFRDITREREANERIELLAHYDPLTGLAHRVLLGEQTAEAIEEARDRGTLLAMLFIDPRLQDHQRQLRPRHVMRCEGCRDPPAPEPAQQ